VGLFRGVPKGSKLIRRHDSAARQHGLDETSDSNEAEEGGCMLFPPEGPCILQGREMKMSTTHEDKKGTSHDTAMPKHEAAANTHDGKLVSITGNTLVMTSKDDKQHTHTLAKDAKLTCDGAVCQAAGLKAGSKIRVTTKKDDRNVATCIESLDKKTEFAQCG
jgi:hypothetical protein